VHGGKFVVEFTWNLRISERSPQNWRKGAASAESAEGPMSTPLEAAARSNCKQ